MTISQAELDKIASLAHVDTDTEHSPELAKEISAIMDFVEQLRTVDTTNIPPLCHPLAEHQRQRADEVTEASCLAELAEIAPLFEDDYFLVPKVL